jgi:hypothetical protein
LSDPGEVSIVSHADYRWKKKLPGERGRNQRQ